MADITIALPQPALHNNFTSGCQFRSPFKPEPNIWLPEVAKLELEEEKERIDIWNIIQNEKQSTKAPPPPYIHPLARRSSSLMSQKSLEICTESLGSETGSDGFSSGDEFDFFSSTSSKTEEETEEEIDEERGEETEEVKQGKKELASVNYHCSIGRRTPARSFPPPLPSISSRDGPCLKMRPHRRDGRLVVEAVPVPSQTYLHAERQGGRLLLSFINSSSSSNPTPSIALPQNEVEEQQEEAEDVEEEEVVEEEVEVVDRGTIVEVKVSGLAAVKVHRSSLVINKFVVGSPLTAADVKLSAATTTAAAAAVAASSISAPASTSEGFHYNYLHHHQDTPWGTQSLAAAAATDAKLLFASKRLRREELLHDMRRCSELRRPLFIFEQPHCIATSS
ncbi:hypothetical protein M5K25_023520 [Dendrobium thyrsiflorum]|uniref:FAF domain-containing protein n=1 Tax=Dendrobium thyrsiflorum TaxID=117978 RepID=A0ABD0U8Z4_DENTH